MLRALKLGSVELFQPALKSFTDSFTQSTRNTYILKRRWPPKIPKKNQRHDRLRGRHFVYDLIEDTTVRPKSDMEVLLTTFVEGVGQRGEVVKVKSGFAYNKLLLPGLATYNTPENREKYKLAADALKEKDERSSPFVDRTINVLQSLVIALVMNKDQPWTVEPWHIKVALRKMCIYVPEDAIELPPTPIKGPDLTIQNKEFPVTITINNKEKAVVKFRIHHWSTDPSERLPYAVEHWKQPAEPLFREGVTTSSGTEAKAS